MKRADAITVLKNLRPALQARGVAHAGLFGSVARDQADARSDVDVVITPAQGKRFDLIDLGGLQTVLEDAFLGLQVDVIVEPIRKERLGEAVARDRANAF